MASSKDVRIEAQLLTSQQINTATCLSWIRNEMMNIAAKHFRAGKYTVEKFSTSEAYEIYEPEKALARVDKLITNGTITNDYEVHNGTITLLSAGEYELRYYAYPETPQTEDAEIQLPLPYIQALKFYVSARQVARIMGQNDTNATSFYKEYETALESADTSMERMTSRHRRMPPGRR